MSNLITISTEEEYQHIVDYLRTSIIPRTYNKTATRNLKRKASKLLLINDSLFVNVQNNEPLEFIPDFHIKRKKN